MALPGGVSGTEFAEVLAVRTPDLPVVFMPDYSTELAMRERLAGLGKVLLNKPFRQPELAEALRDALD